MNGGSGKTWVVDINGEGDFTSISAALASINDNDVININNGMYKETIRLSKPVSLIGIEDSVQIFSKDQNNAAIIVDSDNITISGVQIKNSTIGIEIFGKSVRIESNYITNNSVGIKLNNNSDDITIVNNYFSNDNDLIGYGKPRLNTTLKSEKNIIGGSFVGGNYWKNYQGFDGTNDGIGDTQIPYEPLSSGEFKDWLPLTKRKQQEIVYVGKEYDESTDGYDIDHFSSLVVGIDAVKNNGQLFIASGNYSGSILLDKKISMHGEGPDKTILIAPLDLGYEQPTLSILQPNCVVNNLSIHGSILSKNGVGLNIETSSTYVSDISISGFLYGIRLWSASNNILENINEISQCITGVYTTNAYENRLLNSRIHNCSQYGLFFIAGSDNNIIDGVVFENNEYGLRIKGSTLNLFLNSTIKNNQQGLYFCCGARNNTVSRNIFLNNFEWHAKDQYSNNWDYQGIGNYWDDYGGSDANNDGIGDSNYDVSTNYSSDRYPIVDLNLLN